MPGPADEAVEERARALAARDGLQWVDLSAASHIEAAAEVPSATNADRDRYREDARRQLSAEGDRPPAPRRTA